LTKLGFLAATATLFLFATNSRSQDTPASRFKDEYRMPWTRGSTDFIRRWTVAGPIACKLDEDCVGGEAGLTPGADQQLKLASGGTVAWRGNSTWSDYGSIGGEGSTDNAVGYAFALIERAQPGKATLSLGSSGPLRAWLNGSPVFKYDGERSVAQDNDQVAVDLKAGQNLLLIKVPAAATFVVRVLESGAITARAEEINPSLLEASNSGFTVLTDVSEARRSAPRVKIEVIRPGGSAVFSGEAARGERLRLDASAWPEGPYEVRFVTPNAQGRLFSTHLPWYKGDSLAKARELAAEAAKADGPGADKSSAEGLTLKMLAKMVDDRLGKKVAEASGNPWASIHSPLMEFDELMLERQGKTGRVRPHGFLRLAWIDETDGTPQFCRAYLPGAYDAAKKWPLVLQLHGFNPANPEYWDWWSADNRGGSNTQPLKHAGVIYIEPHGRGNVQYLSFGDADVMRCLSEARQRLSVDENRTYLTGDSMGGWGTWNVATRHPEVFAAIAPIFGGVDYHSTMDEALAKTLTPAERFINEKQSSWALADALIHTPIFVHHGDADQAVNVEWSRWGVRLLQRWGYDIRYREYPGKVHEALQDNNGTMNFDWFLEHERNPAPRQVRIRSAELRNASAYWISVQAAARPLEFMRVDAEVVDRNTIRLDTDNVADLLLAPPAAIIDGSQPVVVVWNGERQQRRMAQGKLRLTRADHKPAALHKTPALPGASNDFFNTPFALVVGTTAKDAALQALIENKAQGFVRAWKDWQKFEPRVFKDTEISEAEVAKYSLLLIGGADANAITARLAPKLPLKVSTDRVVIDGKAFPVRDAAVSLLYPNPRNAARYVWVFASTSGAGMQFASPTPFRTYEWDYVIDDGHVPAPRQNLPMERTSVVSGKFDQNWRFDAAYLQMGDAEARAKGRKLAKPGKQLKLPAELLEGYAGTYRLPNGRSVVLTRKGDILLGKAGPDELDFVPLDENTFYGEEFNVWVTFDRDASGKVTGFSGYQPGDGDFEAARQ
jgi:dienelactone hydrolase